MGFFCSYTLHDRMSKATWLQKNAITFNGCASDGFVIRMSPVRSWIQAPDLFETSAHKAEVFYVIGFPELQSLLIPINIS